MNELLNNMFTVSSRDTDSEVSDKFIYLFIHILPIVSQIDVDPRPEISGWVRLKVEDFRLHYVSSWDRDFSICPMKSPTTSERMISEP